MQTIEDKLDLILSALYEKHPISCIKSIQRGSWALSNASNFAVVIHPVNVAKSIIRLHFSNSIVPTNNAIVPLGIYYGDFTATGFTIRLGANTTGNGVWEVIEFN